MGTLQEDILLLKKETTPYSITPPRLGSLLERMSLSKLSDNAIPMVVSGQPQNSGWQAWDNETKQHFGLPNKPIITYHPAKQETQLGENSPKLEIGRNSTRLNLGNQVSTIQIGKYTGYLEVGKKAQNILLGDQNKNTTVGRDSEKASFGEGAGVVLIGGKNPSQKLQIGDETVGCLRAYRVNSTNIMHVTPRGGVFYIGKYKKNDLPLNKISIGYRGSGDVLRAGSSPNYYHLASDPSKNSHNRFMQVYVGAYADTLNLGFYSRKIEMGSYTDEMNIGFGANVVRVGFFTRNLELGNLLGGKTSLSGQEIYIKTSDGSYGDISSILALNNKGRVYEINENNFRSWLGILDIVEMINNIKHQIGNINGRINELHPNS